MFVVIILCLMTTQGCKDKEEAMIGGAVGMKAPEFELTNLDGEKFKLSDQKGKVVLVDFWATWCPPCRMAMPHLEELSKEYAEQGLVVVGIATDQQGSSVVKPFVDKNNLTFHILQTYFLIDRKFGGVSGIPTTFILGRDGIVGGKLVGYKPKAEYEAIIKKLL